MERLRAIEGDGGDGVGDFEADISHDGRCAIPVGARSTGIRIGQNLPQRLTQM